jgi:serine/threonine protein kinase
MAAKSTEQTSPHVDLIGKIIDGRYEVKERLGGDGVVELYRAEQLSLGRSVAIKMLLVENGAQMSERFLREARLLSKLDHPGIVHVIEAGVHENFPYLVRDFIEGRSLEALIHEKQRFSVDESMPLVIQVCEALEHAHTSGVIHRDLVPTKILIGNDGRPRITDLGFARMIAVETGPQPLISPMTNPGVLVGTPEYASPELALGRPVDRRTDLYSLGVIAYRMISGRLPYEGNTHALVLASMKKEKATRLIEAAGLPRDTNRFCAIIDRLLEADPIQRCSSASWVAHALRVTRGEQSLDEATEDATLLGDIEQVKQAREAMVAKAGPKPKGKAAKAPPPPPEASQKVEIKEGARADVLRDPADRVPSNVAAAKGTDTDTIPEIAEAFVARTPDPEIDERPVQNSMFGIDMDAAKTPGQRVKEGTAKIVKKALEKSKLSDRSTNLRHRLAEGWDGSVQPKVMVVKEKLDPKVDALSRHIQAGVDHLNNEWTPTFTSLFARVGAHPVTEKAKARWQTLPWNARWAIGAGTSAIALMLLYVAAAPSEKTPIESPVAAEVVMVVSADSYGDPTLHAALAHAYAGAGRSSDALQHFGISIHKDPSALADDDVLSLIDLLSLPKPQQDKVIGLLKEIGPRAVSMLKERANDKTLSKDDRKHANQALAALGVGQQNATSKDAPKKKARVARAK